MDEAKEEEEEEFVEGENFHLCSCLFTWIHFMESTSFILAL